MRLIGTFNWSIINDSMTLKNTDGETVFTQIKVANGLHKVSISGLNGKYNYFGDILSDGQGNEAFILFDKENEILRVIRKKVLMLSSKYDVVTELGDYKININSLKTKAILTNGEDTAMTCIFTGLNYDMSINDNENPVFICSVFYGIVLLMNL